MTHDSKKHYSFRWNSSVYTLRRLKVLKGKEIWTWVNLFSSYRFGDILSNICDAPLVCLRRQEEYRKKHSRNTSTVEIHDSFIDMLSYWAGISGIEI